MVNRCGLGLAARFDAAKDVMDNDSVRDFGNSVDDNITKIINYYKQITSEIKKIDK